MTATTVTIKNIEYKIIYPCIEIPIFQSELLGVDIETAPKCDHPRAGLDPYMTKISLVQIYDSKAKTVYVFDVLENGIDFLKPLLETHEFIAHNSKFELTHLMKAGATFKNSMHCTMLMSQLIGCAATVVDDPDEDELDTPVGERDGISAYKKLSHSLDNCCIRWLGVALDKNYQTSAWGERPLSMDQIKYAAVDAIVTHQLFRLFIQKLQKYGMLEIYKLQKMALLPIVDMETAGISFDWIAHEELIEKWKTDFEVAKIAAETIFGKVNLASNKQMGEWLNLNLPQTLDTWPRTPKGALSFTATSLADFRHLPQIECLFRWKKLNKLLTTYGTKFALKHRHPITDRVHTSFTLGETATGRLSSRSPNLQNQPRDGSIRSLFTACPNKVLVVADFSQIELRLQAEISQDEIMLEPYRHKQDIYKVMAASLYGKPIEEITKNERSLGKVSMLSLGYGTGARKLRATARSNYDLEIDEQDAYQAHTTYHQTFYRYSTWCDEVRDIAEHTGFARTLTGKLRLLEPKKIYTTAPNHVIQGTATELLLRALINARNSGLQLLLSVHDELIVQCYPGDSDKVRELLEDAMCEAMEDMFPNAVDYNVAEAYAGKNWAEAKEKS